RKNTYNTGKKRKPDKPV
ncbi:hypothetical protein EC950183_1497, partial [Escherichia coli 95.0183]